MTYCNVKLSKADNIEPLHDDQCYIPEHRNKKGCRVGVWVGGGGIVSLFYSLCEMPLKGFSPTLSRYMHHSGVSYQRIAFTKS